MMLYKFCGKIRRNKKDTFKIKSLFCLLTIKKKLFLLIANRSFQNSSNYDAPKIEDFRGLSKFFELMMPGHDVSEQPYETFEIADFEFPNTSCSTAKVSWP